MTSTFTKILVAAAAVSALSLAACSKPAPVENNVVETTNVVEAAPADANTAPADNAVANAA